MKICVISATVFKVPVAGYSGLEHLAWLIAKGLAAKGHTVSLVAPDESTCPGVEIIPIGPEGQVMEHQAYDKYWQMLPNFDVIIDHSWQKHAYTLKGEGRLKAPVLGVCHAPVNTMFESMPPDVDKPCFVCISKDQAAHFQALFSREARVAYNGVDMDYYKPLGTPRSDRFLFLARFSTIKGPHLAIEACRAAGVGLDLVGDTSITQEPEYLAKCKAMCDGLSTSDNRSQVLLRGPASRGETVWWFSQAHAMLHPNKMFREPFGLAPVEAMACGCPVIAWDNGAMRETISPDCGWLVRSVEELAEAVQNVRYATFVDVMRKACRDWASQFSVPKMIDCYEELCKEAIEGGGW